VAPNPTDELRQALRDALKAGMASRDRVAVDALRVAIAAIENLEAQPLDGSAAHRSTAIEDAPASAEVPRRVVSGREVRAVVEAEVTELEAAAAGYEGLGEGEAAERARHQAEVLRSVLASAASPADPPRVSFRPLVDDDLPLLHRWLNEPGVVRWWEGDDVTWEGVVNDYGSQRPPDEVEHWIAVVDGADAGWIQCYPIAESPEEAEAWLAEGVDPRAAGIDYLVGEPGARGRGVGSALIAAFVEDVVFGRHPDWTQAAASPYVANEASWRALRKAGFHHVADIAGDDDPDGPARLMVIDRPTD
jgi:aminoglycoside 6'-N-acetyltransferase